MKKKEKLLAEKDSNQEKLQKEVNKLKTDLVEKEKQINDLQVEKKKLIQRIILHKKLTEEIEVRRLELRKLKDKHVKRTIIGRSDVERELDIYLEAQAEIIRSNNSFAIKQKAKARDFLQKKSGFDKLGMLEEKQQKLTKLEIQLEDLEKLEKEAESKFSQEKNSETGLTNPTKSKNNEKTNKEKEFGLNLGATVFGHGGNIGLTYKSKTSPQLPTETSEPQLQNQQSQPINITINTSNLGNQLSTNELNIQEWANIHINFTARLAQEWVDYGFTVEQTRDWINVGLTVQDYAFAAWLRDVKGVDAEWVLNQGDVQVLKSEFVAYQQSRQVAQIIHNPPKNS